MLDRPEPTPMSAHPVATVTPTPVAAKIDARGKRIANRSPWLDLPPPFDNLQFRAWLDYPREIADLLVAPANETPEDAAARSMEFYKSVILEHDGWEDGREHQINPETEQPYGALPQPDKDEFWERISTPLGRAISERFFGELEAGNVSRASQRWKRKNSRRR